MTYIDYVKSQFYKFCAVILTLIVFYFIAIVRGKKVHVQSSGILWVIAFIFGSAFFRYLKLDEKIKEYFLHE